MKICRTCKNEKHTSDFCKRTEAPDGLQYDCKICMKIYAKKSYYKHRKKNIERSRKWNIEHRKQVAFNIRAMRERDYERVKKLEYEWKNNNKDKIREYNRKKHAIRRAAKSSTINRITPDQWEVIKSRQKNTCLYCGEKKKLTQDHRVPLSKGGDHSFENIVAACLSCNTSKHALFPEEFAKKRGRLLF